MEYILSIITVLGAVSSALFMYRLNATSVTKSVMDAQKERINLLVENQKAQDQSILHLTGKIAELQGQNQALKDILQLRNPEMEKFIKVVTLTAVEADAHMKFAYKALKALLKDAKIQV